MYKKLKMNHNFGDIIPLTKKKLLRKLDVKKTTIRFILKF